MKNLLRAMVAPLMLSIGVATVAGQVAVKADPDGRLKATPTPTKRERIQAAIASMQSRAVLPAQGEIGETGEWIAPATDSVTFVADGMSDFGAVLDVALLFA